MSRSIRLALAGCVALAVAMGIGRFAFTPILPLMQGEGVLDVAQGGWLASANYLGYLAGGLTAMRLRFGAQGAIRIGLALVGASTLAMGITHDVFAWLLLRAAAGMASAWVLVFASAWGLERFEALLPVERATARATLFAGVGLGVAFAGAACVVLAICNASAARTWIALGALSFAAAVFLRGSFGNGDRVAPPEASSSAWSAASIRLTACYGAFGFGYIIPATFLAAMARDALPEPQLYGWAWPLFGVAAAASTFVAARWGAALSERGLWIAGHAIMALGVATPLVLPGLPGILVSALLVGGTFMVVTMAGMGEARRVAGPTGARWLIAAMTSAFAVGQVAGPLAVSFLAARGLRYEGALVAAAAALVVSALALAIPQPKPRIP